LLTEKAEMDETQQQISLPDGRQISFSVVGEGTPVLYFYGTASSRLETLLLKEFARASGFQIIGVDRPGFGLSKRLNPEKPTPIRASAW
jgi:pimeloyl-ACP methyl ester carboxylesterase